MARIELSTFLPAPPERIWTNLRRTALLRYICAPRVSFRLIAPAEWPVEWEARSYALATRLYGLIPAGVQRFAVEFPATTPGRYAMRQTARDFGGWDHVMMVEPAQGGTLYTDMLELSGPAAVQSATLTPGFFRHRHARWAQLVENGFDYGIGPDPLEGEPA